MGGRGARLNLLTETNSRVKVAEWRFEKKFKFGILQDANSPFCTPHYYLKLNRTPKMLLPFFFFHMN